MIAVKNLSKKYGDLQILKGLSVNFPKGKLISLIGGNGVGKSTLLSLVSRLIEQDSGEIQVDNQNIGDIPHKDFAKKVSFLRQSNFTHIRIKVCELVSFGRFPYNRGRKKTTKDHRIIEEVIERMNLSAIRNKYVDELSGGQRQRAYLAMILAQDTECILLDEPLNNLDMKSSVEIMKVLKILAHKHGKTVILIVHDINIAAHFSDYIAALNNGVVEHFGPTKDVIQSDILESLFGLEFDVVYNKEGRPIIHYFN